MESFAGGLLCAVTEAHCHRRARAAGRLRSRRCRAAASACCRSREASATAWIIAGTPATPSRRSAPLGDIRAGAAASRWRSFDDADACDGCRRPGAATAARGLRRARPAGRAGRAAATCAGRSRRSVPRSDRRSRRMNRPRSIRACVPHAGAMCLLDAVIAVGRARTSPASHRRHDTDHPLRRDGRVPAIAAVRIRGAGRRRCTARLLDGRGRPRAGMLAS